METSQGDNKRTIIHPAIIATYDIVPCENILNEISPFNTFILITMLRSLLLYIQVNEDRIQAKAQIRWHF